MGMTYQNTCAFNIVFNNLVFVQHLRISTSFITCLVQY